MDFLRGLLEHAADEPAHIGQKLKMLDGASSENSSARGLICHCFKCSDACT